MVDLHNPNVIGTLTGVDFASGNKISQGDSSVEVIDSGTGSIVATVDNSAITTTLAEGFKVGAHAAIGAGVDIDYPGFPTYEVLLRMSNTFGSGVTASGSGINLFVDSSASNGSAILTGIQTQVQLGSSLLHGQVIGGSLFANVTGNGAVVTDIIGVKGSASSPADNATITKMVGGFLSCGTGYSMSNFTVTDMIAAELQSLENGSGDVSITNLYGLLVRTPGYNPSGTTDNVYGVYIEDQSTVGFTADYNIYSAGANTQNIFEGNVTISGDLVVDGTTFVVNNQEITTADDIITVNYGEVGPGVTSGQAGIEVDRGSATNYQFLFVEASDTFRIGEIGSLQAVATREDAPTSLRVPAWNDTAKRFDTAGDTYITLNGSSDRIQAYANSNLYIDIYDDGLDNVYGLFGSSTYYFIADEVSTSCRIYSNSTMIFTGSSNSQTIGVSGDTRIVASQAANSIQMYAGNDQAFNAVQDGAVTLYYNGAAVAATTANGITGAVWG